MTDRRPLRQGTLDLLILKALSTGEPMSRESGGAGRRAVVITAR